MTSSDDPFQELEGRVRRGDLECFEELLALWRPLVKRFLEHEFKRRGLPASGARFDVSDVTQDACLHAHSRVESFPRKGCPFEVWIFGIAKERLIHAVRDNNAKMRTPRRQEHLSGGSSAHPPARGRGPVSSVIRREEAEIEARLLDRLPALEKQVLVLRHRQGLPNKEIAQLLGVSQSRATRLYYSALERYREVYVAEHGKEGPL